MKASPQIVSLLSTILLLIVNAGNVHAASPPAPNKISFTESSADKIYCSNDEGDWSCMKDDVYSYTLSATIAGNFTGLTTNTQFEITLDDGIDFSHTLGDDKKYKVGKSTSATFVESYDDDYTGKTTVTDTTKLKWTASKLSITITGKNGGWIATGNYDEEDSGKISTMVPDNYGSVPLTGNIIFGNTSVTFSNVNFTGTVKTKDSTAKDGSDFLLSTISLKGSGTAQ